jgi:hypothetical protein
LICSTHGTYIKNRIKWKAGAGLKSHPILKGGKNKSISIYHALFACRHYSPDEAAGLSVFFTVLYICSNKGNLASAMHVRIEKASISTSNFIYSLSSKV